MIGEADQSTWRYSLIFTQSPLLKRHAHSSHPAPFPNRPRRHSHSLMKSQTTARRSSSLAPSGPVAPHPHQLKVQITILNFSWLALIDMEQNYMIDSTHIIHNCLARRRLHSLSVRPHRLRLGPSSCAPRLWAFRRDGRPEGRELLIV